MQFSKQQQVSLRRDGIFPRILLGVLNLPYLKADNLNKSAIKLTGSKLKLFWRQYQSIAFLYKSFAHAYSSMFVKSPKRAISERRSILAII